MLKNQNIEFDELKLIEVGYASVVAGRLREAEGQFKEAFHLSQMKKFTWKSLRPQRTWKG